MAIAMDYMMITISMLGAFACKALDKLYDALLCAGRRSEADEVMLMSRRIEQMTRDNHV